MKGKNHNKQNKNAWKENIEHSQRKTRFESSTSHL